MHDEPEFDAYYNTYVEVQSFADKDNFRTPKKTSANVALMLNNAPNKIISPLYQQPPKQYHHQYTKSSPVLLSPHTTKRTTPTPPTPLSPQTILQTDHDDIPPPLPPPNPNHSYSHHHQLSLPLRYQQQLPTPTMAAPYSNNNHTPQQQSQDQQQQQHQQHQYQEQPHLGYNNGEAIYGTNSPTVSQ